jgi:hypothetical protein
LAVLALAAPAAQLPSTDVDRRTDSLTLGSDESSRFVEPEAGAVSDHIYQNRYFGIRYSVPPRWTEGYKGPPPSDTGYYVLGLIRPERDSQGPASGTILLAAWDLFFVPRPVHNAMELVKDMADNLSAVYKVEAPPREVELAGRSFVRLDYVAPVAGLHWRILATDIRCHAVHFVFNSRDAALLERLIGQLDDAALFEHASVAAGNGPETVPACVKDYATGANVLRKVDPVMVGPRFTGVPVRFIIGVDGKIKHIHVINAFPEQAKSLENALAQWEFKPYLREGVPAEVETGLLIKFSDPSR